MPKIPLTNVGLQQNVTQEAVSNAQVEMFDVFVDEFGYINRRPGLLQLVDLGTNAKVDGLYWWQEKEMLIAVSAGNCYSLDVDGNSTNLGSGLERDTYVSFASANPSGTATLLIANGGRIYKTTGSTLTVISDADAPTNVTTVTFLDQYILANNANTPSIHYSAVNDPDTWQATSIVTAETKPDNVTGIYSSYEDFIAVGTDSIETFYNDGSSPFTRRQGLFVDIGSISPYSFQRIDELWLFLDAKRRVVTLSNGTWKSISNEIEKELQSLDTIEDAGSDIIFYNGRIFYVLHFPTEMKTFVYDLTFGSWYRWGLWNTSTSVYDRWLGNTHAYSKTWNTHYVGSRADGKIYKFNSSYQDDAGAEIRGKVVTGGITHGTLNRKSSERLMIRAKRGVGISGSTTEPVVMYRYKNNGSEIWSNSIQIGLGKLGEYDTHRRLNRLGYYRVRQHEFSITDATTLLFGEAEEELTVSDN